MPESDVERLKQGLLMVHGVKACEDDEADAVDGAPDRQPPVKLKNNWFARPFEMFITMYGLPGYGDLDPTGLWPSLTRFCSASCSATSAKACCWALSPISSCGKKCTWSLGAW